MPVGSRPSLSVISTLPTVYEMGGRLFTHAEWEALCNGCGKCCYEKERVAGRVVSTDVACEFLTVENQCRVYEQRFSAMPGCMKITPETVRQGELLPDDCPYVELWKELCEEEEEIPPSRRLPRRR